MVLGHTLPQFINMSMRIFRASGNVAVEARGERECTGIGVQEYDVRKEKMKKADKVAKWREIRASNTAPLALVMWTAED